MSVLSRIRDGLSRTKQQIVTRFDEIARRVDQADSERRAVDVDTAEALEELLLSADLGLSATGRIMSALEAKRGGGLRDLVKGEIQKIFADVARPVAIEHRPEVMLIVGVHGMA